MKKLPKVTKKELLDQIGEFGKRDIVKKALDLSSKAHAKQKRENGASYLHQHIYYVTSLLFSAYKGDEEIETLLVFALLHDTVEDTDIKLSQIQKIFGESIAETVSLLSKESSKKDAELSDAEKYMETQNYLEKLSGNREAVIVKLFDRLANVRCINEEAVERKPKKYLRYFKETKNLYIPLAKKYDLEKLVRELEDEVDRVQDLLGEILITHRD